MRYDLYPNVNAMLSLDALRVLTGHPVTTVRQSPLPGKFGASGSRLEAIETNDGDGPRLVLKRISSSTDWTMRATNDHRGRETILWQRGLFERFPPEIAPVVVACANDGPGWAILMRDVRTAILPGAPFSIDDNDRFLDALAALHATFWNEREDLSPTIGFCSSWHYYTSVSPTIARRESKEPGDFPSLIVHGWNVLEKSVEPDVADLVWRLVENPQPLSSALDGYPQTLVHRDLNLGNLGLVHSAPPRVVFLDWQFAGPSPPGVDLAGYLSEFSALLPVSKETVIERYRDRLAYHLGPQFDERGWRPQLELALLGDFVRLAWAYAFHLKYDEGEERRGRVREELAWWSERARAGAQWL